MDLEWEETFQRVDSWYVRVAAHRQRKKDPTLDKKERLPQSAVLDILFAEFEKYPYWTFKGLAERTNQPHAWLKECLAEVAMINKRGPYVGMYQLLPEYRQKQESAPDAGSSSK